MPPANVLFVELVIQSLLALAQIGMQISLWRWMRRSGWTRGQGVALGAFLGILDVYLALGMVISIAPYKIPFAIPGEIQKIFRVPTNLWLFACAGSYCVYLVYRFLDARLSAGNEPGEPKDSGRRKAVQAIGYAAVMAPAVALGWGAAVGRTDFQIHEVEIPIPGLHPDLDSLRIVQVSDFHLGDYLAEKDLARAIDMANGLRGHFALMTGDLITKSGDPLPAAVRQIARLKADAGVFGCMGNHEIYAQAEQLTEEMAGRLGIRFLRMSNQTLRFGQGEFNLAGVDFQSSMHKDRYLAGAEKLIVPGMPNLLLSHNPDVFPVAAAKGFDATFSGHTHGGQITMEILDQTLNFARFYSPFVAGLYTRRGKSVYVNRGIGTIGVPARLGALPEVTLIRLKRA